MKQFSHRLQVYTDAAKSKDGKVAIAVHIPQLNIAITKRISDGISIDAAEFEAIKEAISWIKENYQQDEKSAVIFTDSMRALKLIENKNCALEIMHDPSHERIKVVWIPGHVNIEGNEFVDTLAKKSLKKTEIDKVIARGENEIMEEIEKIIQNEWQENWTKNEKGAFFRDIKPSVDYKVSYQHPNRKKEIVISRLRFGKTLLNEYMYKLGLHHDGLCQHCQLPETVEHHLMFCSESRINESIRILCKEVKISFELVEILQNEIIVEKIFEVNKKKIFKKRA